MGKRTIIECDLTKQEISEEDDVFTLKIAKKGKRTNMTYELCGQAAEKLLAQLNSSNELPMDWDFTKRSRTESSSSRSHQTLEDLEEEMIAEKRRSLSEETRADRVAPLLESESNCRHMNKGRIQATVKDGKRFIYRVCNLCRARIPESTAESREEYLNGNLPSDINLRSLDDE